MTRVRPSVRERSPAASPPHEIVLGMLHDQHGAGGVADDFLGDAAREQVLDEAEVVLAHDDQLDFELARAGDDRVAGSRHAGAAQQVLRARVLLLLKIEEPAEVVPRGVACDLERARLGCCALALVRRQRLENALRLDAASRSLASSTCTRNSLARNWRANATPY